MRFLLDVNVGATIARALSALGHDVHRAALSDPTTEDPDLLDQAVASHRILITYDRDFSELVFARGAETPPAIIYIRYEPEDVADVVERLMPLLQFDFLKGYLTVIDERRTRRAPFPSESNDNG